MAWKTDIQSEGMLAGRKNAHRESVLDGSGEMGSFVEEDLYLVFGERSKVMKVFSKQRNLTIEKNGGFDTPMT